jgi:hypothetical protein
VWLLICASASAIAMISACRIEHRFSTTRLTPGATIVPVAASNTTAPNGPPPRAAFSRASAMATFMRS